MKDTGRETTGVPSWTGRSGKHNEHLGRRPEEGWGGRELRLESQAGQTMQGPRAASSLHVVVQLLSQVRLFATPWTAACQASQSFTISESLLKLMSIELVMPCNHLILCYPLLLPSILLSMSLFQWVSSSHQVASASVLPMNIQDWLPLGWTGLISLQFKGLSRIFSNTTVQKHQFISTQLSLQSNSDIHTWLLEKP